MDCTVSSTRIPMEEETPANIFAPEIALEQDDRSNSYPKTA